MITLTTHQQETLKRIGVETPADQTAEELVEAVLARAEGLQAEAEKLEGEIRDGLMEALDDEMERADKASADSDRLRGVLQAIHSWLSDYHDNVKCSPGDDASKCAICLSMDEALAALEESK